MNASASRTDASNRLARLERVGIMAAYVFPVVLAMSIGAARAAAASSLLGRALVVALIFITSSTL
jgi:hypothetical protein